MKLIDYLLAFQKRLAASKSRFLIALWSRQTGKGYAASFISSRGAMTEGRSKWLIVAPTERQSLETLDKCKDWITFKVSKQSFCSFKWALSIFKTFGT